MAENAALTHARHLAEQKGVAVTAIARSKQTGAIVSLETTSHSDPTCRHLVRVLSGRLACDCPFSQHGGVCTHRAVSHDRLLVERDRAATRPRPVETTAATVDGRPVNIWR